VFAVGELLLFAGVSLPQFEMKNLQHNAFPNGWQGIFAAIPSAIWFFLAIEGVANVAEEAINPKRTMILGFGSAILTLVILCVLVFISSIGVAGWEAIVYKSPGETSDSPLPLALGHIVDNKNILFKLLVTIGLFGLVASFHGIILAAGRASFEFGRIKYAPAFIGKIHSRFKTPAMALLANSAIGIVTLLLLNKKTLDIIVISVFGALTLYIISMISLLRLRKTEPGLERPFKVPLYPVFPIVALVIAVVSFIAMAYYNQKPALIYLSIIAGCYIAFKLFHKNTANN
jgi:ethanolamine permease